MKNILLIVLTLGLGASIGASIGATTAHSAEKFIRITADQNQDPAFTEVLKALSTQAGTSFNESQFKLYEDRPLAYNHFKMWLQQSNGVPLSGKMIRIWTDLKTGKAILVEAHLETESEQLSLNRFVKVYGHSPLNLAKNLSETKTKKIATQFIKNNSEDTLVSNISHSDFLKNGVLYREVKVKSKRGTHFIQIQLDTQKVTASRYEEFPQFEAIAGGKATEYSVPALVYPIYEQAEGSPKILNRVSAQLKYISTKVRRAQTDPYESLRSQRYFEDMYNTVLGNTPEGRAQGYWSMAYIKEQARLLRESIPLSENLLTSKQGATLEGRYASINIHPAAGDKWGSQLVNMSLSPSVQFYPSWKPTDQNGSTLWEMTPLSSLFGRPLYSVLDAYQRTARRDANHNPVTYIQDGFDEVQVYYAINTLIDSLKTYGFTDPELSSRPFHAFLYDPDIEMRNNAYYTDDTINFTTYTADQPNMARDNSTIWHELGHGVMDRMMGDMIRLADTGGLSEGMADFVAQMVIQDVTNSQPFEGSDAFRIMNQIGFNLTNEVHDDGEAYGGAMNDLLEAAIAKEGKEGLAKVVDLTLEAMRLTRNHPELTAQDWFEHVLYADSLGRDSLRDPNEMKPLVLAALAGRNFNLDGSPAAEFILKNDQDVVTDSGPGSRRSPIVLELKPEEKTTYNLSVALKSSNQFKFKYPVTVKVGLRGGPLQGAVHWEGEEQEPIVHMMKSEADLLAIPLSASGTCDDINMEGGGCRDFAYIQIFQNGAQRPIAKKRFYLRIKNL